MAGLEPQRRNYRYVQREDGGFDFFNGNKKTTIDDYVRATGANRGELVQQFADSGDRVSLAAVNPRLNQQAINGIAQSQLAARRASQNVFNPNAILGDIGRGATSLGKTLFSGLQQSAGNVADLALQGGQIVNELGRSTNPFINDAQRNTGRQQAVQTTENLRNQIKNAKTVTGESLNPNADYQPTGNIVRDAAAVGGRALQTGLDLTMFANPTNIVRGAIQSGARPTARQLINFAGRDAATYGGAQGLATAAQTYGETGDIAKAAQQGATSALLTGATQGVLDTAALAARGARSPAVRQAIQNPVQTTQNATRAVERTVNPQIRQIDETLANYQRAFDVETNPTRRAQINEGIAQLNSERRAIVQGGYIGNRQSPKLPNGEEFSSASRNQQSPNIEQGRAQATNLQSTTPVAKTIQEAQVGKLQPQTPSEQVLQTASKSGSRSSQAGLSVNTNRYNISNDAKQVLTDTVEDLSKDISARTGARLSLDEVSQLADETTNVLRSGRTREATAKAQAAMLNARQKQAVLAEKVGRGEGLSPQEQQEMVRLTVAINSTKADLARQLGALRINASPRERSTIDVVLDKIIREVGNADAVTKAASRYDLTDSRQLAEFYRQFVKATPEDWLDKLRYNSMLSSPLTHSRNIFANLSGAGVVAPAQKVFEGTVDAVASALIKGRGRTRFAGESGSYAKEFLKGITSKEARQNFKRTLSGELGDTNVDINELYQLPLATKGFAGALDKVLSFTTRLTDAVDQWALTGVRRGETAALNYRNARGVSTQNIATKAEQAAEYRLFRNKLGNDEQGYMLKALDYIPQKVLEASRSKNPVVRIPAKLSFPFTKTPTNVAKQMIEYSPLGLLSVPGNVDKTAQIAKAIMGTTAIATVTATLAANDALTFALPTNPADRDKFLAEGKQPYSFKIGDKWISYQYLHPAISFNMAAVSSVNDAYRNGKVTEDGLTKLLEGFAGSSRFFVDQSYFKNAQDFLGNFSAEGFSNPATLAAQASANTVSQFIPFRAAATWIKNMVDTTQRKVDTSEDVFEQFRQNVAKNLPWFSNTVEETYNDALGRPLQNTDVLINAISPARVRTAEPSVAQENTPLSREINRLYQQDEGIKLGSLNAAQKFNGVEVQLNSDQKKQLEENINSQTRLIWDQITKDPEYSSLSDAEKRNALSKAKSDVTAAMKDRFAQDFSLGQYSGDYNGEQQKLSAKELSIANGKINSKAYINPSVSNISTNISKSEQDVLKTYAALSTEEKDNYFYSTTDAEYKYNLAKYNNDKAEGKIKEIDRIKTEKELKKQKVGSTYSKDVRDFYSLSKQDLEDYLSNADNGDALYKDLIAYDRALYDAGVISSLKFKGGVISGSSSRGRSSGGRKGAGDSTAGKALVAAKKATTGIKNSTPAKAPTVAANTKPSQKQTQLRKYQVSQTRSSGIKQA